MGVLSPELSSKIHQRTWISEASLLYVVMGYAVSIICISNDQLLVNALGVVLLIHTLTWAAYFVHELVHGTASWHPKVNVWVGNTLLFLTGSCYCRFQDLARNHLAHHKNRADFSAFSVSDFLTSLPKPLFRLVIGLEWMYFPIVNFILRWICVVSPFLGRSRRDERLRNALLLFVRGSLFILLGVYSLRAIALYLFAYVCVINLLRFIDCFQHTYEVFQLGQPLPQYTLAYEEANTYSNLISYRWSWLNLLLLNFGYHNAHHRVIHCPWYLLPQLDAELYPAGYRQHVMLDRLVANYHRYRIARLFRGQGQVVDTDEGVVLDDFVGGIGVSFLILREPLSSLSLPTQFAQRA
ncbi:MAG TPA: fatty acid desaturase [Elainellaceae cyanobacterium]